MNNINVVSSSCVGGYIMRDFLKIEYINPFVWSYIPFEDFFNLIKYWDEINFRNFTVEAIGNNPSNGYKTVIDNKVNVYWHHYKYDENVLDEPKIVNVNVLYYKIDEYIKKKYEERVERMLKSKIDPIFIFGDSFKRCGKNVFNEIRKKELLNIQSKYKIICLDSEKYKIYESNFNLSKIAFAELSKIIEKTK